MSISQIKNLQRTERTDEELMTIFDIMNNECELEENGVCKKLAAIMDYIDDRYIDDCQNRMLLSVDNEYIKNFYEEEFWKHAPANLKILKAKLRDDPFNYNYMDRFSMLIKVYTYLIKYPWSTIPENPIFRKKEIKRIIEYMSKEINYDIDE